MSDDARHDEQIQDAIRRVVDASRKLLDTDERPVRRGQHPKQHGCVRARFVVDPGLDLQWRQGLFVPGRVYDAWVRFSSGGQSDDRRPDAHGMAVKLMGVEGRKVLDAEQDAKTHDFVMVDNPTFFLSGADEYAAFSDAMLKAKGKLDSDLYHLLGLVLDGQPRELLTLVLLYFCARPWRIPSLVRLIGFASKRIANPLTTRYWSATPYRFGVHGKTKFSAVPAVLDATAPEDDSPEALAEYLKSARASSPATLRPSINPAHDPDKDADYLRKAMAESLRKGGAAFLFQVQRFKDEKATPIEDPTREWKESDSPFRTLAWIWIPGDADGRFQDDARMDFGENLSFTPWHAIVEHEPLGAINLVRKAVYVELSRDRHLANGVVQAEPGPSDDPDTPGATPTWGNDPSTFSRVLQEELGLIRTRRQHVEDRHQRAVDGQDQARVGDQSLLALTEGGDGHWGSRDDDARMKRARLTALKDHVTGLAFSGGGIRSGTFAVGFLQGLAALGLLRRFDYLSTVSGGGYAGAWLAAWLKRAGDPENVERQLAPNRVEQSRADRRYLTVAVDDPARPGERTLKGEVVDEEPEPLRHLRSYSSYLFPRAGLLSTDTWTVILIWVRNVSINLLLLFPLCMLGVVLARSVVSLYGSLDQSALREGAGHPVLAIFMFAIGFSFLVLSLRANAAGLREFRLRDPRFRPHYDARDVDGFLRRRIVYPALLAALFLTLFIRLFLWWIESGVERSGAEPASGRPSALQAAWNTVAWDYISTHLGLLDPPNFLLHVLLFGGVLAAGAWWNARRDGLDTRKYAGASFMGGASGGVLFVLLEQLIKQFALRERPDLMATLAPPGALLIAVASLIVVVALLGRTASEGEREWWARISALLTKAALLWLSGFATILYLPGLFLVAGPTLRAAIASGWLGTAAFGVITGRYVLPRFAGDSALTITKIASVAAQIFLVGLLGAVALLGSLLLNSPMLLAPHGDDAGPFAYYLKGVNGATLPALIFLLLISTFLYLLARGLIDVNLFSLNAMYANRLTRAYLGASRPMASWPDRWAPPRDPRAVAGAPSLSDRDPTNAALPVRDANPVTGFDPDDDLDLRDLLIEAPERGGRTYLGPHLLINTTLNLVGGGDLACRDRKGESFLLSPLYCGSRGVGYARREERPAGQTAGRNLTLGRAISISGAAVDPNMSFYQSAPLTALLTLFNARLGYWIEKPRPDGWSASSPRFSDLLLTEFFGRTDGRGEFVHISDGGHFENLGVYELVRRRCRYIVALDAGEDGDPSDDNLANLIRLCRIDFGVRIRIDTTPLKEEGPDRLTRSHVVVGQIHYDDVDRGEMPGVLVYVKISMTGDEPPDLQKYARKDPRFPHQPTDLRQSFDEEQFEAYRCLGDHIARGVFEDAVERARIRLRQRQSFEAISRDYDLRGVGAAGLARMPDPERFLSHNHYVPMLFSAVQGRWTEPPEGQDEHFLETAQAWSEIQRDLGSIPALARLSHDLYPELSPAPDDQGGVDPEESERAELHTIGRMLGIMEGAWISLGLKRYSSLPMNRGRMNTFRRWTGSRAFRRFWPTLRPEFGADFVQFCETQLHLTAAEPSASRLEGPIDPSLPERFECRAVDLLSKEFEREWPAEVQAGRGLSDLIERAIALGLERIPVWLITLAPSGPAPALDSDEKLACGIILAAEFRDHPAAGDPEVCPRDAGTPVELFVWVRRPQRSVGLASWCLTRRLIAGLLGEIERAREAAGFRARPSLWARYPEPNPVDGDIEFENWVTFLARYDFTRRYPKEADSFWGCTLLERK